MATRATWELDCDRCLKGFLAPFMATGSQSQIRRAARSEGWHALAAGKTYCPDHNPERR